MLTFQRAWIDNGVVSLLQTEFKGIQGSIILYASFSKGHEIFWRQKRPRQCECEYFQEYLEFLVTFSPLFIRHIPTV